MLYYKFNNYEEFQELFGLTEHENGKTRKNKILLTFLKNRDLLHEAVVSGDYALLHISNMAELKQVCMNVIQNSGLLDCDLCYPVQVINYTFYSATYETDGCGGVCVDGDLRSIRYINHNNEKVYKMKAGKFLRALILETEFGRTLPEQVVIYLQEEFTQDFQVYASRTLPENKLFVNDEFERIYNSENYAENTMHSCMVDEGFHTFYEDAVKAKAAYLENEDGKIVARCIIYTEVHEKGSNKIWRLAERQYAIGCSDLLKRALVDALIRGGHIDGYKQVGAGCGDSNAFVSVDGTSLSDKRFYIDCVLETYDTLSYQDSFKHYSYAKDEAYNFTEGVYYDYDLAVTDGSIEGREEEEDYDDYHNYYCNETTVVYVHGGEAYCDSSNLEDFKYIERLDEYHHIDDVAQCEDTKEYDLLDNCYYSELTDLYYSTEDARSSAEQKYKEENWTYSLFDDEYYEDEADVVSYQRWNKELCAYEEETIYIGSLINLIRNKVFFAYGDTVYNMLRHGEPLLIAA